MYGLVGLGGALRVHGAPAANVLDSYEPGAALLAARLALAFALSLSFPVMFLVARTHVYSLAGRRLADQDHDASRKRVSAAMVALALVLALYFPRLTRSSASSARRAPSRSRSSCRPSSTAATSSSSRPTRASAASACSSAC